MRELVVEVIEFGVARSLGGSYVRLCGGDSLSIVSAEGHFSQNGDGNNG